MFYYIKKIICQSVLTDDWPTEIETINQFVIWFTLKDDEVKQAVK